MSGNLLSSVRERHARAFIDEAGSLQVRPYTPILNVRSVSETHLKRSKPLRESTYYRGET